MKIKTKWARLTDRQREQAISLHSDELKKKELFLHDLNHRYYNINSRTGNLSN